MSNKYPKNIKSRLLGINISIPEPYNRFLEVSWRKVWAKNYAGKKAKRSVQVDMRTGKKLISNSRFKLLLKPDTNPCFSKKLTESANPFLYQLKLIFDGFKVVSKF